MNKLLKLNDLYKSTDFSICSVLVYFNHLLDSVDKSDPNRCVFTIRKTADTDQIIENFHNGLILVEPKRFSAIQKEIKGRIYNN